MKSGRASWQEEEETRKYFRFVLILQENFFFRALQGRSGRNLIDPSLQDNVLIPDDFLQVHLSLWMSISLHSITNSGLIPGGQNFEQTTDSILSACGSNG